MISWNIDSQGKRTLIQKQNEQYKVVGGKFILNDIPDFHHKISITSMVEINFSSTITSSNQFKVNYDTGEVYFDSSKENSAVTISSYYSVGKSNLYAKNVPLVNSSNIYASTNVEDFATETTTRIKDFGLNIKNYGAIGDGITDDTPAFVLAEAATGQVVFLPDGTYIVNGLNLAKRYTGMGKIKLNGTMQASNYTSIRSLPTTGANAGDYFGGDQRKIRNETFEIASTVQASTVSSNYYNWELQPHLTNFWVNSGYSGFTTMTTGSNNSGQSIVNVRNTHDLSVGIQVLIGSDKYTISIVNSSTQFTTTTNLINTYTAGTVVTKGNRTMFDDYFSNLFHMAGGDAYSYISRVVAGKAPDADQTHFSYNSTAGIIGGDLTGVASGVYLTGSEMNFIDVNFSGSHDIAAIGDIRSFQRTNATGAYGCVWVGTLYKSEGTQYCEGAHVVSGKWKGGLDLACADFGTDKAAIKIAANHKIYFNSSGTVDAAGFQMWSNTVGTTYMDYNSSTTKMESIVGGVSAVTWNGTNFYVAGNVNISTNNKLYLDGGTNTYLFFDGTNIKLFKGGSQVAIW